MLRKIIESNVLFACAPLLLSGVLAGQIYAQQQPPRDAIEGLDPVMLAQGKEAQGEMNITVTFDGQPWKDQSSTIETIAVNGAIDPALFEKPKQGQ